MITNAKMQVLDIFGLQIFQNDSPKILVKFLLKKSPFNKESGQTKGGTPQDPKISKICLKTNQKLKKNEHFGKIK